MNKVLNQEETNDLAQISKELPVAEGKIYDLASQDLNICNRIQNIGLINDKLAKNIKIAFSALFKKNIEISIEGISPCKFEEYIHSLSFPTSINQLNVLPINESILLILDPALVFCLVENFFGGEGKTVNKILNRQFTASESRIIKLTIEQLLKNLKEAWSQLLDVQFVPTKTECDPAAFSGINATEIMMIAKFKVDINQIGGELHVCYTSAMIDHIRDFVNDQPADSKDKNKNYLKQMQEAILEAKVDLHCILAHKTLSIGDVVKFKKGDIIPIEIPLEMLLSTTKVPLFKSTFGTFEGKYAAKIITKWKNSEEQI